MSIMTAEDGYFRDWLLLGSFPGIPQELASKALIPESSLLPHPGLKSAGRSWMAVKSQDRIVNLLSLSKSWPQHAQCCGYAHLYVHSATGGPAVLALGSDDGSVLWLNGERVFATSAARGNNPDQDRIQAQLTKGWNRILVKILQYDGAWSFCLRILDEAGKPLPGISSSLKDPLKGRWPKADHSRHPLSIFMQAAGEPKNGSISLGVQVHNLGAKPQPRSVLQVSAPGVKELLLKLPALKPLEDYSLSFELPLSSWAQAFLQPVELRAMAGKASLSRLALSRPGLAAAFTSAAASMVPSGLGPFDLERLERLRRELSVVTDGVSTRELASSLEALTRALLGSKAEAARQALGDAEAALDAAAASFKGQAVHLVGHAHIDMNWLWRWPETLQCCVDTFSQALRFMDEFPEFRFTQSQAAAYEAIQAEEPELFERIKAAVKRGQWNVVGGMWVEGDTNLASGEAIARSCLLAQRYFQKNLGLMATTGWLPDNFGHTAQLPQIFRLSGIDAFYHSRTGPEPQLYAWQGLDGTRILAKTGQGYNDQVTADIRRQAAAVPEAGNKQMFVYGVGDHGGGPTRQDISTAKSFQGLKLFPELRFSSADEYFKGVRERMDGLHVQEGELGYIFEGCYTNIARIKQGNRDLENLLAAAESLAFAAWKLGQPWPAEELTRAWKILAFNQFHDILPGSAIHPSNDDSRAAYAEGLRLAGQVLKRGLRQLGGQVKVPMGGGIPILAFNPLAWENSELAVAEIVVTERFKSLSLKGPDGEEVPAQAVFSKDFGADFHVWVQFYAKDLPALGYKCYSLSLNPGTPEVPVMEWGQFTPEFPRLDEGKSGVVRKGLKLQNRFYEAELDPKDGTLKSLRPRNTNGSLGKNLFAKGGGNQLVISMEKPHPMSAWTLDPTALEQPPLKVLSPTRLLQEGPESVSFRAELGYGRSRFILDTTFHVDSPRIDCRLKADWLESGSKDSDGPMLRAHWNLAKAPQSMACDVPFGVLKRQAGGGQELPAQKWVEAGGLALFNRGKYGHSLDKTRLRLSLLRSSYDPDPFPDLGQHTIEWALTAAEGKEAALPKLGASYNVPPQCFQARPQQGSLDPKRHSFLKLPEHESFVVTGIKKAEDGESTVLRGYDSAGQGLALNFDAPVRQADLLERPLGGPQKNVAIAPWGIATFLMD